MYREAAPSLSGLSELLKDNDERCRQLHYRRLRPSRCFAFETRQHNASNPDYASPVPISLLFSEFFVKGITRAAYGADGVMFFAARKIFA